MTELEVLQAIHSELETLNGHQEAIRGFYALVEVVMHGGMVGLGFIAALLFWAEVRGTFRGGDSFL